MMTKTETESGERRGRKNRIFNHMHNNADKVSTNNMTTSIKPQQWELAYCFLCFWEWGLTDVQKKLYWLILVKLVFPPAVLPDAHMKKFRRKLQRCMMGTVPLTCWDHVSPSRMSFLAAHLESRRRSCFVLTSSHCPFFSEQLHVLSVLLDVRSAVLKHSLLLIPTEYDPLTFTQRKNTDICLQWKHKRNNSKQRPAAFFGEIWKEFELHRQPQKHLSESED